MSDEPENKPKSLQDEIAELVRKELIQVSELQSVEERLRVISEKASKVTPGVEDEGLQAGAE